MQKKDQVFLYIKDEIEKISSAEEKEILDEAKAIEQEAYNQLRGEAEIDAKHQLDKELAEISSKASIEASAQLEERLKKLVEKREEYVNTIFTEVKNKLVEFVNSSNYLEYLTSHVKAVTVTQKIITKLSSRNWERKEKKYVQSRARHYYGGRPRKPDEAGNVKNTKTAGPGKRCADD